MPESMVMRTSSLKTRAVFDRYNVVDESDLRITTLRARAPLGIA